MAVAGESARATAHSKRVRAEELMRDALRWDRGAEGEEATGRVLAALTPDWAVIHDVHWPGRPQANIDHVVVGPSGVFVIDSKNWVGSIRIAKGVLHHDGRAIQPTVNSASEAALAVARLVPWMEPRLVRPVLCFSGAEKLGGMSYDVMVCSTTNVISALLSQPATLQPEVRRRLILELDAQLWPATSPVPQAGVSPPVKQRAMQRRATVRRPRARRRLAWLRPLGALAMVVVLLSLAAHPGALEGIGQVVTRMLTQ